METLDGILKFKCYSHHTFRYIPRISTPHLFNKSPAGATRTALFRKKPVKPYTSSSRYRAKFREILYYTNNNLLHGGYIMVRDIFILTRTNVIGEGLYT